MIRRPPRSTQSRSSAASDVYKRQACRSSIYRAIDGDDRAINCAPTMALGSNGLSAINVISRSESFASSHAGVEDCLHRLPFLPFAGESWIGGFFPGGESKARGRGEGTDMASIIFHW